VGTTKRSISVTRDYQPELEDCTRALALLFNKPVRKEGGPPTALDSAKGGSSDSSAKTILHHDP
jgi:hypothetical protein